VSVPAVSAVSVNFSGKQKQQNNKLTLSTSHMERWARRRELLATLNHSTMIRDY
jgi:hypothetical protein